MRLTPAEVHNVAFKKPSIGKRGYDEDEVDAFLDLVEDELARLIEENNELTARLRRCRRRRVERRGPTRQPSRPRRADPSGGGSRPPRCPAESRTGGRGRAGAVDG